MRERKIQVPEFLIFEKTIDFIRDFKNLEKADKFIFDFSKTRKIDSFSLLYCSSELQLYRSKNKDLDFRAKKFDHLGYAAHMGFFQAFGLDHGKFPGEAKGNSRYIPIQILDAKQIRQDAREQLINPAELLETHSEHMAKVLTQTDNGDLYEIIVYCMREILRNVIEHSQCDRFGFCAQYLPSLDKVSLAILDRGIGIKCALKNNPNLDLQSDKDAILESIKPGISGKIYKGQKRKPKGDWANSGYGLYMTSNICIEGGSFFIASGNTGLYASENKHRFLETPLEGTAVNLTLNTNRLKSLKETLSKFRDNAATNKEASKSTMGLSKSNK